MISLLRISLVTVLSVVTTACTATYPTEPTTTTTLGIQITFPARGRVAVGSNNSFAVIATDSDGVYHVVTSSATWSSSDETVARPVTPGVFAAGAPGIATVSARYEGFEVTAPLAVVDSRSLQVFPRLLLSPRSPGAVGATTTAGQVLLLSSSGNGQNVTAATSWTTADATIATLDANGRITGRGLGTTLITASYQDFSDWFWVSIAP